jgi:DNA end-binding protein Ku
MLDDKGAPLERRYYDPGNGKTVPWEDLVRGFELSKGEFVVVEDEELEALAPEKSRDIDLQRFVPAEQLDPIWFLRSYFLAPGGESTKAYRLLAATMEKTGRAGIATFVMRDTPYLAAILAEEGLLRAEVLRFPDELRTAEDIGLTTPRSTPAAERKRMLELIRANSEDGIDEKELADAWSERLEKLVMSKRKKGEGVVKAPKEEAEPADVKVIDLLEVLKKSMAEASRAPRKPAQRAPRKAAKKTTKKTTAKKAAAKKRGTKKTAAKATKKPTRKAS